MAGVTTKLPRIVARRLCGSESFTERGRALGFDVLSFWRWGWSDLLNNATRGVLAEYLVAQALGVADGAVREPWDAYDLTSREGIKIEVKSASYIQSWFQSQYSKIGFRVPRTRAWDAESNRHATDSKRQADVYVFCVLACRDPEVLDPCDVAQWEFYVVPTSALDRSVRGGHSLTFGSLQALCTPVEHGRLADAVREAAAERAS